MLVLAPKRDLSVAGHRSQALAATLALAAAPADSCNVSAGERKRVVRPDGLLERHDHRHPRQAEAQTQAVAEAPQALIKRTNEPSGAAGRVRGGPARGPRYAALVDS
jgi:hypothetical protein